MDFKIFSNNINATQYGEIRKIFKDNLNMYISQYFEGKPLFGRSTYKLYYYDEYELNTCVIESEVNFHLYLEIDNVRNYKNEVEKKKSLLNVLTPKHKLIKETYLTLKQIKHDLKGIFLNIFDSTVMVGLNDFSVILKTRAEINGVNKNINIVLTPCFTHENENKEKGVLYYNDRQTNLFIEYPKLSIKHFNAKNRQTKGNFALMVNLIKNFYKTNKTVGQITFEPFEVLIYNVPNTLMQNFSQSNVVNILNYLRNADLSKFKTLDGQDNAFVVPERGMLMLYARAAIKNATKGMKKMKLY